MKLYAFFVAAVVVVVRLTLQSSSRFSVVKLSVIYRNGKRRVFSVREGAGRNGPFVFVSEETLFFVPDKISSGKIHHRRCTFLVVVLEVQSFMISPGSLNFRFPIEDRQPYLGSLTLGDYAKRDAFPKKKIKNKNSGVGIKISGCIIYLAATSRKLLLKN